MRMRRHHAGSEDEAGIDLTPMLDIVFIMLILFYCHQLLCARSGH